MAVAGAVQTLWSLPLDGSTNLQQIKLPPGSNGEAVRYIDNGIAGAQQRAVAVIGAGPEHFGVRDIFAVDLNRSQAVRLSTASGSYSTTQTSWEVVVSPSGNQRHASRKPLVYYASGGNLQVLDASANNGPMPLTHGARFGESFWLIDGCAGSDTVLLQGAAGSFYQFLDGAQGAASVIAAPDLGNHWPTSNIGFSGSCNWATVSAARDDISGDQRQIAIAHLAGPKKFFAVLPSTTVDRYVSAGVLDQAGQYLTFAAGTQADQATLRLATLSSTAPNLVANLSQIGTNMPGAMSVLHVGQP